MTDYATADLLVRIANVPEIDPVFDKILAYLRANRPAGYAREDDLIILEPTITFVPEFDAFAAGSWVDVAFRNEGANPAIVTLSDATVPSYRQLLEPLQTILVRTNKAAWRANSIVSTLGTRVRMFAWGEPQ